MTALPPDAIAALKRGSKIEAIKCVRLARGLELKEAKDAVEAYAKAHPEALRGNSPGLVRGSSGNWWWILLLLAAAVIGYLAVSG
jgi:hypothetical protein